MSNCGDKFRLLRDGTSQEERLLAALQPAFVAVEERTVRDLTHFAQQLAAVIVHNSADQVAPDQETLIQVFEDWVPFFTRDPELRSFLESDGRAEDFSQYLSQKGQFTDPQLALFLTFLQLWKIARDDMNGLTARHLDYYYKDVLRLRENAAQADSAFVLLELARHKEFYNLPKGTLLRAGKDKTGVEILFATDKALTLSHAQVSAYKSIWQAGETRRPLISPIANSADGAGAAIETEEQSWAPFGESTRPEGEVGFCISSASLQLEGGHRNISLLLQLDGRIDRDISKHASALRFDLYLSGAEAWLEPLSQTERKKGVLKTGSEVKIFESKNLSPELQRTVLSFVNQATRPEQIHAFVSDDPHAGYGNQIRDYGIGKTTATQIIKKRQTLRGERYRSIKELDDVRGMGPDKIGDLAFSLLVRESQDATIIDLDSNSILIMRSLEASQEPVVNYKREVLLDPIDTPWPVAKVLLRSTDAEAPHPSTFFGKSRVKNIEIEVDVNGLQQVVVQNESAVLDASKVLQPFGSRPRRQSHFYVGSREVFSKRLQALSVTWEWEGLGELEVTEADNVTYRRMSNYYDVAGYTRTNSDFEVSTSLLSGYQWQDLDAVLPLFTNDLGGTIRNSDSLPEPGSRSLIRTLRGDLLQDIPADQALEDFKAYKPSLERGFLRLSLTGEDFGHHDFQKVYTNQVLNNTKVIIDGGTLPEDNLPREPYTPAIKAVQLNYRAADRINLMGDSPGQETGGQYFHLGPFGVGEVQAETVDKKLLAPPLLTDLQPAGQLCLGIARLGQVRSLSLLIQVLEGSANPASTIEGLQWSYLHENQWRPLPAESILSDGTNGLVNSGIVQIKLPAAISDDSLLMTEPLHWLRISITGDPAAVPEFIGMHTQAVTATFQDRDNDPLRLGEALPAESISKLRVSDAAVAGVTQPYASFGGKLSEEASNFYTRVSERLRHKRRAITLWDYEHLILQDFPEVYKIKCLNHTGFRRKGDKDIYSEMLPGHVTLVVLSNVRNKNAVDPLKPRSSLALLSAVNRFIEALNPAWVLESPQERNNNGKKLHVINPVFEEIRLDFEVRFHPGYDGTAYAVQLREEIRAFLSPWAFDSEADISFGGKIHKSRLLYFVEERPYVDFVTCFRMYHRYADSTGTPQEKEVDEARATRTASVLGSVGPVPAGNTDPYKKDHVIRVMEDEACTCDDNIIQTDRGVLPPDDYPIR